MKSDMKSDMKSQRSKLTFTETVLLKDKAGFPRYIQQMYEEL